MLAQEGLYNGQCKEIGPNTSSKGTPFIDITFDIMLVAANGAWDDLDPPLTRHLRIYLSDAAWSQSLDKLKTLGFNGDFQNPKITEEWVELECKHEEYNGRMGEKWELANWGGGADRKAPDENTLRVLSARYKTSVSANKKPTKKPPAINRATAANNVPASEDGPPPSDEQVPF
jgi:hypothetical protein